MRDFVTFQQQFSHHILPEYIKSFLESSIESLKFSEDSTFERDRLLGMDLHNKKKCMSHKTAEKLNENIWFKQHS